MPNNRLSLIEIHYAWMRQFSTINQLAAYFGISVKTACKCILWGRERANRGVATHDDLTVN